MVTDDFHDFFVATAGVAGALIGLLFVAMSVAQTSGSDTAPLQRVRAGAAMSALIDALLVSLFALLPGTHLGTASTVLAVIGLSSTAGLGVVLHGARLHGRDAWRQWRRLAGLLGLYAVQLVLAFSITDSPADTDAVHNTGLLVVLFFTIGIARAWELVEAPRTGLIGTLRTRNPAAAPPPDAHPTPTTEDDHGAGHDRT